MITVSQSFSCSVLHMDDGIIFRFSNICKSSSRSISKNSSINQPLSTTTTHTKYYHIRTSLEELKIPPRKFEQKAKELGMTILYKTKNKAASYVIYGFKYYINFIYYRPRCAAGDKHKLKQKKYLVNLTCSSRFLENVFYGF